MLKYIGVTVGNSEPLGHSDHSQMHFNIKNKIRKKKRKRNTREMSTKENINIWENA